MALLRLLRVLALLLAEVVDFLDPPRKRALGWLG